MARISSSTTIPLEGAMGCGEESQGTSSSSGSSRCAHHAGDEAAGGNQQFCSVLTVTKKPIAALIAPVSLLVPVPQHEEEGGAGDVGALLTDPSCSFFGEVESAARKWKTKERMRPLVAFGGIVASGKNLTGATPLLAESEAEIVDSFLASLDNFG